MGENEIKNQDKTIEVAVTPLRNGEKKHRGRIPAT